MSYVDVNGARFSLLSSLEIKPAMSASLTALQSAKLRLFHNCGKLVIKVSNWRLISDL
jgi:hypothetical protein